MTRNSYESVGLLSIVLIAGVASCSAPSAKRESEPHDSVQDEYVDGVRTALADWRSHSAVIQVFRNVGPKEMDTETGLPYRDAGSDAVDPLRASFIEGYNSTVRAVFAATQPASQPIAGSENQGDSFNRLLVPYRPNRH